jgi:branched-chain amino acid transport system permease protein
MTILSETTRQDPAMRPAPATYAGLSLRAWQGLGVALVLVVACVLPFTTSSYHLFQLTMVLVYAIALLGLNILTGFNGQVSLGHGAFYAIGAYTTAILLDNTGIPYWATLPIAGVICLGAGFLFGLPALRLEGLYLALATFALAVATPQLLKFRALEKWTGGVQGIVIDKPSAPDGIPLDSDQWLYFVCLAVTVPMFLIGWNLLRGRTGRAIVAIRDHPIAAASMGVDTAIYKSLTFGVSAMYTGIAGALGALAAQFVSPDSFSVFLSISLIVGLVVGGIASIFGVLFGAAFIVFVPNIADQISKAAPWAIYGIFLIGFMYVLPTGVAGGIKRLGSLFSRGSDAGK